MMTKAKLSKSFLYNGKNTLKEDVKLITWNIIFNKRDPPSIENIQHIFDNKEKRIPLKIKNIELPDDPIVLEEVNRCLSETKEQRENKIRKN